MSIMVMERAEKLDGYRIKCPYCGHIDKRCVWSIAHIDVTQTFNCPCGQTIIVEADE